jgi:hypothetical protein
MNCPKCGVASPAGDGPCAGCGTVFARGKVLCEECRGAYPPGDLEHAEGRLLCPVCRGRKGRREAGFLEPGLPRLASWHMKPAAAPTSGLAVASLVSAFVFPPAALLLGVLAAIRVDSSRGRLKGKVIAMAGAVLGAFFLVVGLFLGLFLLRNADRERFIARESSVERAAARLQKIVDAQARYREKAGAWGRLDILVREGLLDKGILEDGAYKFDVFVSTTGRKYSASAVPRGGRGTFFLLDEEGNLRYEEDRPAVAPLSPLWRDRDRPLAPRPARVRGG